MLTQSILRSEIRNETDIVWARKKARELASFLSFDSQDQTRIATAISEVTRNAFQYAKGGVVEYSIIGEEAIFGLKITVRDQGPGIPHLQDIENGTYVSKHGMGVGLMGAKRLVDDFSIETGPSGTSIVLFKIIPNRKSLLKAAELNELTNILMRGSESSPIDELQKQNREILNTIAELNEKKEELTRLNQELQDTNRGVVALYAELDEKAESLKIASEAKTSFLSNMTHEFRSPLNSILSIAGIIMNEAQVENAPERLKQVNFIIKAAKGLSDMVNDLLDIAKIEAGKIEVRNTTFHVSELFSTLRGLMRPINTNENVHLNFEVPEDLSFLTLNTDEGKLSQILRNLISNALKYTEKGEVRVIASIENDRTLCFEVRDTGIGIPPENIDDIFEEFIQIENPLQKKSKGTGLGLSLSKKLSKLLDGELSVESTLGTGSSFQLRIPLSTQSSGLVSLPSMEKGQSFDISSANFKVLIIDDDSAMRYSVSHLLHDKNIILKEASSVDEGLTLTRLFQPDLIILDLVMPEKTGIDFINELVSDKTLRDIPIILHTSKLLDTEEREFLEQSVFRIIAKMPGNKNLKEAVESIISRL